MKSFKDMTELELQRILTFTEALAEHTQGAPSRSPVSFSDEDAPEPGYVEEARRAAEEYARARREGKRTRSYAQETELQKEGVASALDWLARKRKSVVRK